MLCFQKDIFIVTLTIFETFTDIQIRNINNYSYINNYLFLVWIILLPFIYYNPEKNSKFFLFIKKPK